jgi:hypothetical protein
MSAFKNAIHVSGSSSPKIEIVRSVGNAVPDDHIVRGIDAALDLSWLAVTFHLIIRRWVVRRSIHHRRLRAPLAAIPPPHGQGAS